MAEPDPMPERRDRDRDRERPERPERPERGDRGDRGDWRPPPYRPQPRAGSGCLPWVLVLVLLALGGSALLNLALLAGQLDLGGLEGGKKKKKLREEQVQGEAKDQKVCLIDLSGVILEDSGPAGPFSSAVHAVTDMKRRLDAVRDDDKVRAVVIRIDSPGGSVTASDGVWREVSRFRKDTSLPVVVSMGGVCASGGYYVAAAADRVVAEPTTITGSIGVIMSTVNVHGLLERYGVQGVTIKAGANKDLLDAFAPIKEEHKAILQSVVDDAYARFVQVIVEGRSRVGLGEAEVRALADGRVYTATQALENKLIDEIGYLDDAIAAAEKLAGTEDARVFRYTREPSFFDVLSGSAEAKVHPLGIDLSEQGLIEATTPRIYYLYR